MIVLAYAPTSKMALHVLFSRSLATCLRGEMFKGQQNLATGAQPNFHLATSEMQKESND